MKKTKQITERSNCCNLSNHYKKQNKCQICGKIITDNAIKCKQCHLQKIILSYKRRKICRYLMIINNPNYKDGRSKILYNCIDCGKKICWQTGVHGNGRCKSCARKITKTKHFCIDCKKEISLGSKRCKSCATTGNLSHSWKGGKSFEPYNKKFNKQTKKRIKLRDTYTCQLCGIKESQYIKKYKRGLDVHHIDYNKKNCKDNNLISLCISCHMMTNWDRKYWLDFLKKIIGKKYEK